MVVGDPTVLVLQVRAVLAMDLLGGVVPGAVEGDQAGVVNAPEGVENTLLTQGLIDAVIDRE